MFSMTNGKDGEVSKIKEKLVKRELKFFEEMQQCLNLLIFNCFKVFGLINFPIKYLSIVLAIKKSIKNPKNKT